MSNYAALSEAKQRRQDKRETGARTIGKTIRKTYFSFFKLWKIAHAARLTRYPHHSHYRRSGSRNPADALAIKYA